MKELMPDLLFIRHAHTALAGTFCGHTDPPLDDLGLNQLPVLIAQLDRTPIDLIYTSDLRRAHTTALAIAHHTGAPLTTTPALREIHFGDWEGLTWSEIEARDQPYAQRWIDESPHVPIPNGEPIASFEQRILTEISRIQSLPHRGRIAIVTHAGVLRVVLRTLCGLSDQQAQTQTQTYCCTFTFPAAKLAEAPR